MRAFIDRHVRPAAELIDDRVGARPRDDRLDVSREHQRRVAGRLAAGELELLAAQDDRRSAELRDPDLERDARSRRRPREEDRDALARERLRPLRAGALQLLARSISATSSSGLSSVPVMKWRGSFHIGILRACPRRRVRGVFSLGATVPMEALRVLTWNLFHGRDHPPDEALFTWRSGC